MNLSHIVNTEENPVKVKIVGEQSSGGGFEGTFEEDSEGKLVLRIVDAAPFAYDPNTDSKKMSIVASKAIKHQNFTFSETVAGGETEIKIVPPPRKIWNIQNLNIDVASIGGSTGKHDVYFRLGSTSSRAGILSFTAPSTSRMMLNDNTFSSSVTVTPSEPVIQYHALNNIYISEDCPLYIIYQNKSDLSTTGTSYINVSVIEEGEL